MPSNSVTPPITQPIILINFNEPITRQKLFYNLLFTDFSKQISLLDKNQNREKINKIFQGRILTYSGIALAALGTLILALSSTNQYLTIGKITVGFACSIALHGFKLLWDSVEFSIDVINRSS